MDLRRSFSRGDSEPPRRCPAPGPSFGARARAMTSTHPENPERREQPIQHPQSPPLPDRWEPDALPFAAPGAYSDYIIYADESGDHGLERIDPSYPVFVLAFCIVRKSDYVRTIVRPMVELKLRYFGNDLPILHSHEIRKSKGDFAILQNEKVRRSFLPELSELVSGAEFTLVASVIDKLKLKSAYELPANPYVLAMKFCLEHSFAFLKERHEDGRPTQIVCESRGTREDEALESEFRRICDGANPWGKLPFHQRFARKACNSSGLQLADLAAHPIGRAIVSGNATSLAYQAVLPKFRRSPSGSPDGWGRKVFP